METDNVTIIVNKCARCGGAMEIISARMEDEDSAVIEAACLDCGGVVTVSVLTEAAHE